MLYVNHKVFCGVWSVLSNIVKIKKSYEEKKLQFGQGIYIHMPMLRKIFQFKKINWRN